MSKPSRKFRDLTIERPRGATYGPKTDTEVAVYEHSVYERTSVLAGQPRRVFIGSYPDVAAALRAFPGARVIEGTAHLPDEADA